MQRYELLLFLHIVGAIVWVGLGLTGHALAVWAYRRREWEFSAKAQEAFRWIEPPAVVLGPLLLLGTGIALVVDGPWGFTDTWVVIGLSGFGAALGLGLGFQAPGLRRFDAIASERGVDDPEAIALGRRLNGLMWPELAILTIVVLAMATKPSGRESVGFWVVVAIILVVAGVLMAADFRAAARDREPPAAGPAPATPVPE